MQQEIADDTQSKYVWVNHIQSGTYNVAFMSALQVLLIIVNAALTLNLDMVSLWFPTAMLFAIVAFDMLAKAYS